MISASADIYSKAQNYSFDFIGSLILLQFILILCLVEGTKSHKLSLLFTFKLLSFSEIMPWHKSSFSNVVQLYLNFFMLSMFSRSLNINSPWIYQLSKFRMATACYNAMLASKFDLPFQLRRMLKKVLYCILFYIILFFYERKCLI